MESESRVLSTAEATRWLVLALVFVIGIVAFFALGKDAVPFHPVQVTPAVEGRR